MHTVLILVTLTALFSQSDGQMFECHSVLAKCECSQADNNDISSWAKTVHARKGGGGTKGMCVLTCPLCKSAMKSSAQKKRADVGHGGLGERGRQRAQAAAHGRKPAPYVHPVHAGIGSRHMPKAAIYGLPGEKLKAHLTVSRAPPRHMVPSFAAIKRLQATRTQLQAQLKDKGCNDEDRMCAAWAQVRVSGMQHAPFYLTVPPCRLASASIITCS